jgi:hypothetical protein
VDAVFSSAQRRLSNDAVVHLAQVRDCASQDPDGSCPWPWYALLHNTLRPVLCSCPLAGLALLTFPDVVHSNSVANRLSLFLNPVGTAPTSSPAIHQLSALSGVFSCAISSAYGLAFYHGYDEWLYMSIPGRLFVSAICLATWLIAPEKMSPLLLSIMVWDGACAVIGGYLIGDFSGRKPGRLEQGKDK